MEGRLKMPKSTAKEATLYVIVNPDGLFYQSHHPQFCSFDACLVSAALFRSEGEARAQVKWFSASFPTTRALMKRVKVKPVTLIFNQKKVKS